MMMSPMAMGILVVPTLKAIDETSGAWDEVADRDANGHGKKDPESKKAVEEGELLALQAERRFDPGYTVCWTSLSGLKRG